jgi:hypothetical protein
MRNRILSVPELGFIVGTRGMLGAGIGLLLADKITAPQRRAVGWMLVAVGAVTTIPAAMAVFGNHNRRLIEPPPGA